MMEGRQNRPCGFIVGRSSFRMPNAGHLALNGSTPWGPERDLQLCGAPGLRPLRIGEDVRTGTGGLPGVEPLRHCDGSLDFRCPALHSTFFPLHWFPWYTKTALPGGEPFWDPDGIIRRLHSVRTTGCERVRSYNRRPCLSGRRTLRWLPYSWLRSGCRLPDNL